MPAESDGSDVIMCFIGDKGAIEAECQTLLDKSSDKLLDGFDAGHFFEVQQFSFSMNLEDKDPTQDTVGKSAQQPQKSQAGSEAKLRGKFADWKYATEPQKKNMKPYQLRMDEFSITRVYDCASPVLFDKCCNSASFKSAILVKRRDVGGSGPRGFLRIEFGDVLVTHVQWKNDWPMTEEVRFIFRNLKITYLVVSFSKSTNKLLLQDREPAEWEYQAELVTPRTK